MPSLSIAAAVNHTVSAESRLSRSAGGGAISLRTKRAKLPLSPAIIV
jgi:hypothetical protein